MRARAVRDIKATIHTYIDSLNTESKTQEFKIFKGQLGTVIKTSGYWNGHEEKYETHYIVKWDGFNTHLDLFVSDSCVELIDAGINMFGLPKDHPWKKRRGNDYSS